MLLSEMFGVERDEKFMVDGMFGEYRVGLFGEKYEKLLTINSFGDWIPAKDGLLCVFIDIAPSGIIHLPPPLADEQRTVLMALYTLGYRWVCKDNDGAVYAFDKRKPSKGLEVWANEGRGYCRIHNGMAEDAIISLVSWSDPEPYDIGKALGGGGMTGLIIDSFAGGRQGHDGLKERI